MGRLSGDEMDFPGLSLISKEDRFRAVFFDAFKKRKRNFSEVLRELQTGMNEFRTN